MAQNEQQGVGSTGQSGSARSKGGAESSETSGSSRSAASVGGAGSTQPGGQQGTTTGREPGQTGGRISRRETLEDPISSLFGGSPFALFRRLSDDMDRLFFGGSAGQNVGFGGFGTRFVPHIDIDEREDRLVVRADLPGVRPDDFRVDVEDDALVLQGERRSEQQETRGGMRRTERTYGSFRRVIPLPPGANVDAADARFENGVLEIEIPLEQQSRTRHLEVRSGGGASETSGKGGGEPIRH